MRWVVLFALALPLAACRQTVLFVQTPIDGGPGGMGGIGGTSGVGGFAGGPASCAPTPPTAFELESPEVIVALDRSTGMSAARWGNTSVLGTVRQELDEFSKRFQKVIRFGYVEFPGNTQVCTQCGACVSMLSYPVGNLEGFTYALHLCEQNGFSCPESEWRATTAALARCADAFGRPEPISRYVLLITNGPPDCDMGQSSACNVAQELARDLYNQQQVVTIVLAPGQLDPYAMPCLQDLAMSGGARSNFRPTPTPTELSNELENITRAIASNACHLDLFSPIQNESRAELFWGDVRIPHDQDEGWDLDHSNGFEVVLHGTWCDRLIAEGPADLKVFTNCTRP